MIAARAHLSVNLSVLSISSLSFHIRHYFRAVHIIYSYLTAIDGQGKSDTGYQDRPLAGLVRIRRPRGSHSATSSTRRKSPGWCDNGTPVATRGGAPRPHSAGDVGGGRGSRERVNLRADALDRRRCQSCESVTTGTRPPSVNVYVDDIPRYRLCRAKTPNLQTPTPSHPPTSAPPPAAAQPLLRCRRITAPWISLALTIAKKPQTNSVVSTPAARARPIPHPPILRCRLLALADHLASASGKKKKHRFAAMIRSSDNWQRGPGPDRRRRRGRVPGIVLQRHPLRGTSSSSFTGSSSFSNCGTPTDG